MTYVSVAPEIMASAVADLDGIGEALANSNAAAAAETTSLAAAAGDEVSTAIAALFSEHAQAFQALTGQVAAFHEEFSRNLLAGADSYATSEAASIGQLLAGGLSSLASGPVGRPSGSIGGGLAFLQQEIATFFFGSRAGPPIQPTQPAIFNGAPSLGTRLEIAALWPAKDILIASGIETQLSVPGSPLLSLFASNAPPLSLFLGNSPPKLLTLLLGETVQHTTYDGMPVVQITPAHPSGYYVVAIHGGAFIFPPSIFHWIDYTVMAHQTGATIEVPIYPLLQQGGTAGTVVPEMAGFISMEIAQHGQAHVSVIGDSAGGNLALAAAEYLVQQGQQVPASMVLLSPWLEVGFTNPNIAFVHDPLLPIPPGQQIGKVWAGNLPENNYMVSPLYGSLNGLPPTTVYSGSLDSLAPDVLVLQQEAAATGAPFSFVLATGQIHDWILLTPDGFQYWRQIDQELGI